MDIQIVGLVIAALLAFWFVRGVVKTQRMNNAPVQNALFIHLANAAASEDIGDQIEAIGHIEDIILESNFSSGELTSRMAHACSMVKTTGDFALYERSKKICDNLVRVWPERYSNQLRN